MILKMRKSSKNITAIFLTMYNRIKENKVRKVYFNPAVGMAPESYTKRRLINIKG